MFISTVPLKVSFPTRDQSVEITIKNTKITAVGLIQYTVFKL